ncbi:type II 3-dehydroquinate dehydratase [Thermodesulfobacteriota bacterium]
MRISVINGPNLNMLGVRETNHYGSDTLDSINAEILDAGKEEGVEVTFFQSNSEGELVSYIQGLKDNHDGVIINPGAYTHTSIAIRDSLLSVSIPFVEVHLSNVYAREEFRKKSYFSDKAIGVISGFSKAGYMFALKGIVNHLRNNLTAVC